MTKEQREFHKELDKDFHRKRMDVAAWKVFFISELTVPDFLSISDDPVFSETNPPYDQDTDSGIKIIIKTKLKELNDS